MQEAAAGHWRSTNAHGNGSLWFVHGNHRFKRHVGKSDARAYGGALSDRHAAQFRGEPRHTVLSRHAGHLRI